MQRPHSPTSSAWVAEIRATFALGWPLVVASLGQIAMTATDVAMMGRLGPDALAAGALGSNLFFFAFIFGMGLLSAVSAMLAREFGANRFAVREPRRTVRQGLWSAVIVATPACVILWRAEDLLHLLGQEPRLVPSAAAYTRALMWSLFPALAFVVLRAFVSALQRPRWALVITLGAVLVNAFANWVLMFGNLGAPALGVVGAGIATTIVSTLMVLAFAFVLSIDRRFRRYRLFGRWWRADWPRLRALWRVGAPLAAILLFEVSIFNAAVFLMGIIGPTELAAHQIAIQIAAITFMVPLGLGQAVTVRVGRAAGAGDPDGVTRAGAVALAMGVGFMAMTALVMVLAPATMIALFIDVADAGNAEVVRLATAFLLWAAIFQIVDGAQAVAVGMLRGLHDTQVPMVLALIGYWGVGFPLGAVLAFPAGLGGEGIWIGLAAGLGVVAVLLLRRWSRRHLLAMLPSRPSA